MATQPGDGEHSSQNENIIEKGIGTAISGRHMKGRYEPLEDNGGVEGWGIVHLYRDSEETSGLYQDSVYHSSDLWSDGLRNPSSGKIHSPPNDEECTTLCILAVPSYMTPSDFLSFVGEGTRSQVSHFRMVRTSRANRYMVLMKFKHGKQARIWQNEWNGKVFNTMEVSPSLGSGQVICTADRPSARDVPCSFPEVCGAHTYLLHRTEQWPQFPNNKLSSHVQRPVYSCQHINETSCTKNAFLD